MYSDKKHFSFKKSSKESNIQFGFFIRVYFSISSHRSEQEKRKWSERKLNGE